MRRSVAAGLSIGLLAAASAAFGEPQQQAGVKAEARVERVVLDVLAVDPYGEAIPDLPPSAFRVLVDGRDVALEAADWIPAPPRSAHDAARAEAPRSDAAPAPPPAEGSSAVPEGGRLFVFFIQTDFARVGIRVKGQMRLSQAAVKFLDELRPDDRVAVLSYDSRLKLRLDFTGDRRRVEAAIFESLKTDIPEPLPPGPEPSLARYLDFRSGAKAATVEMGMLVTARALLALPGPKWLLYLGWGNQVDRNPRDPEWWTAAVHMLRAARATVFTLDVTDADYHTLETGLRVLADTTGGTYAKTHQFPTNALARVFRHLEGRYELVFALPDSRRGGREVKVTLVGRKGDVLHRPAIFVE